VALPRGSGPPSPAAVARALLEHIEGWYATHAEDAVDPAVPLPERRYVAGGAPREVAWDEDAGQLTVAIERVSFGARPTGPVGGTQAGRRDPGRRAGLTRLVSLEVQIVRPAPALDFYGRAPERDELDAHGYLLGVDAKHLAGAVVDAASGTALLREIVPQAEVVLGDLLTLGPSGKVAGLAQVVTVPLL